MLEERANAEKQEQEDFLLQAKFKMAEDHLK
jgi:hypothetical protein